MRRPLQLALGMLGIVVFAACAGGGATPAASSAPPASVAVPSSPPASTAAPSAVDAAIWLPDWADEAVPDEVRTRRALPFCGVERAPQPQPGIFVDRAIRLCFWNAHLARAEAEFASIQSTMEGNTIATIYRLTSDGAVDVITDMTQDPFGGGWHLMTCRSVEETRDAELLSFGECGESTTLE